MSNNYSDTSTKTDNKQITFDIAIIGAGLTGLISADLLENAFNKKGQAVRITIFEKSAGVGRLATRYRKSITEDDSDVAKQWQFDFGAQFFTAKSDGFQSYLQPWIDKKVVEPWRASIATMNDKNTHITKTSQWDSTQPRYISSPKMTSFGRDIAQSLQHTMICYKTRVAPLTNASIINTTENKTKTSLVGTNGELLGTFDWVVCTAPQPQALELIAHSDFVYKEAIAKHKMLACYTLMLGWQDKEVLPTVLKDAKWDIVEIVEIDAEGVGANKTDTLSSHKVSPDTLSPLAKVFIEHHKPNRDEILPSITIHSSNLWAEQHVDEGIEHVQAMLLASAQSLLQWNETNSPEHVDCHRWRYAATAQEPVANNTINTNNAKNAYFDNRKQWIVTGDWCIEGRIESCFDAAKDVVNIIAHGMSAKVDI